MAEDLRTARLVLEPWSDAATALMAGLARTPAVMRHIGDGRPWSDAKVQAVAERNTAHWRGHGFGWRLARRRDGGEAVGFISLNFAGEGAGVDPGEYEIGWWLQPAAWGRGLAREGAAAVRDEAFHRVGAPSILARIVPANAASLAVARAIGLSHERDGASGAGVRIAILRLAAAEHRAGRRAPGPAATPPGRSGWPR